MLGGPGRLLNPGIKPTPWLEGFLIRWPYTTLNGLTSDHVPGLSFSRSSVLGYFDSSGDWDEVGVNLSALDHDPDDSNAALGLHCGGQATNQIRNPVMAGAVAATDTLPNFWSVTAGGITPTVESVTTSNGTTRISLRFNGTPSADPILSFEDDDRVAAVQNDVNTISARIAMSAGDLTNVTDINLQMEEYSAVPALLATQSGAAITPTATLKTYSDPLTAANASTATGRPGLKINWDGSGAIDLTLDIELTQMESGPIRTAFMESDGVNAETRQAQLVTGTIADLPDEGILTITATAPDGVHASGDATVFEMGADATDQVTISRQSDKDVRVLMDVNNSNPVTIDIANWSDGQTMTLVVSWAGNELSVVRDGGSEVLRVLGDVAFNAGANNGVSIGHDTSSGTFFDGGHVGSVVLQPQTAVAPTANLFAVSEDLSDAAWSKSNTTITVNDAVAPNGTTTADKVQHSTSSGIVQEAITAASTNEHTGSVFIKKTGDHQWLRVGLQTGGGQSQGWFDITNGIVGANTETGGAPPTTTAHSILDYGDYYRVVLGAEGFSSTAITYFFSLVTADGGATEATATFLHMWGFKLEAGGLTGYEPA